MINFVQKLQNELEPKLNGLSLQFLCVVWDTVPYITPNWYANRFSKTKYIHRFPQDVEGTPHERGRTQTYTHTRHKLIGNEMHAQPRRKYKRRGLIWGNRSTIWGYVVYMWSIKLWENYVREPENGMFVEISTKGHRYQTKGIYFPFSNSFFKKKSAIDKQITESSNTRTRSFRNRN